jgi:hypothetical protein
MPNIPGEENIPDKNNETIPEMTTLTVIEVFGDIQLPQLLIISLAIVKMMLLFSAYYWRRPSQPDKWIVKLGRGTRLLGR